MLNIRTFFLSPKRQISQSPKKKPERIRPNYYYTRYQQFGIPLENVINNYGKALPPITKYAMAYITKNKSQAQLKYLFRQVPKSDRIWELKQQANMGKKPQFNDGHEAAAILKAYLRELPKPLIPSSEYRNIITFQRYNGESAKVQLAMMIIRKVPQANKPLLWRLFKVLHCVGVNRRMNHMGFDELGSMIGPIICWPENDSHLRLEYLYSLGKFAAFLITYAESFFKYNPDKVPNGGWNEFVDKRKITDDTESEYEQD